MKKYLLLLLTLFALNSCEQDDTIIDATADKKMDKVDVCHYNADTDTWETISINGNALKAHLGHGDYEGECSELIDICHYDKETNTRETISISEDELEEHLEHGDYEGECREGYTYVPDDAFECILIRRGYDELPLDNFVPTANISDVRWLQMERKGIKDLTGIEGFVSLVWLRIAGNELTSLDFRKNILLRDLRCSFNKLTFLDISKNLKLKKLSCSSNNLTNLDISKNLILEDANLIDNHLTNSGITGNTNLTSLYLQSNSFEFFDGSKYPSIKSLLLSYNQLKSIDITKNVNLEGLSLLDNQLTEIDLSKNINLKSFNLSENQLKKIDLTKNVNLEQVSLTDNHLTQIDIRNGNNEKIGGRETFGGFYTINNPYLKCIQVDDATYSTFYWSSDERGNTPYIDDFHFFSEDCGY